MWVATRYKCVTSHKYEYTIFVYDLPWHLVLTQTIASTPRETLRHILQTFLGGS